MPTLQVNGAEIDYDDTGTGAETIVFAHGLLFDRRIFDPQIEALRESYRCVAFDFRGQGRSEITRSGYDIETLAGDAAALIEALGAAPCHFVGLSMGGFVGLRLAIRRPPLLRSLVLLDSSADAERRLDRLRHGLLAVVARWFGLRPVVRPVLRIMFGEKVLNDPLRRARWRERILANDRIGASRAVGGVLSRSSVVDRLDAIDVPTLIVVGDRDRATPPSHSRRMHAAIRGSHLVVLPGVGHMSALEDPSAVTDVLRAFLASVKRGTPQPAASG